MVRLSFQPTILLNLLDLTNNLTMLAGMLDVIQ